VTARDSANAAAALTGAPQDVGQWGPVVDWPVVGVHVALLPNGNVLAYDSVGDNATESYAVQDHTRATVWDPTTGTQTSPSTSTPASTSSAAAGTTELGEDATAAYCYRWKNRPPAHSS
jgi:hypothetical protein